MHCLCSVLLSVAVGDLIFPREENNAYALILGYLNTPADPDVCNDAAHCYCGRDRRRQTDMQAFLFLPECK